MVFTGDVTIKFNHFSLLFACFVWKYICICLLISTKICLHDISSAILHVSFAAAQAISLFRINKNICIKYTANVKRESHAPDCQPSVSGLSLPA